jgi:hypothetical protein
MPSHHNPKYDVKDFWDHITTQQSTKLDVQYSKILESTTVSLYDVRKK